MFTRHPVAQICHSRRAQILLPAVMLAPIFILVIYLLFETAKVSMTKVRQQFALDNGAYSQMSTTSGYLNALAMVNGNLPYRVMKTMTGDLKAKRNATRNDPVTIFDVFYEAGAFPAGGPNHSSGKDGAVKNKTPAPESNNWDFQYFNGKRKNWMKEDPSEAKEDEEDGYLVMTSKEIADNYFFGSSGVALTYIKEYATIFIRTGSIYASQTYVYEDTIKKSRMFRESYFLNTGDCTRRKCGQQAADILDRYELESKPWEINKTGFYVTADYAGSTMHSGAYMIHLNMEDTIQSKLFQFAYLTPSSRSRLKQLGNGIVLKQKYTLPANRFNINLAQRYQPYVRNTVSVSCPRAGNNCVWPNPLPKYSVKVGP